VADKLLLASSFVVLAFGPRLPCPIPLWLAVVVLSRDVIILVSVAVVNLTLGRRVFYPSMLGKLSTFCQLLTVGFALLSNVRGACLPGIEWLFDLALGLTVASALHYVYLATARPRRGP
jgi:cardiolipin synthase